MEAILNFLRQIFSLSKFQANAQGTLMIQSLTRIIGVISTDQKARIQQLSQSQMDALAAAADHFSTPADLEDWLQAQNA